MLGLSQKRSRLVLMLAVGLVALGVVVRVGFLLTSEPRPIVVDREKARQIRKAIAQLQTESLDESIRRLPTDAEEMSPRWFSASLKRVAVQIHLEETLQNRRAIKVIGELNAMAGEEQASRLRHAFDLLFETHVAGILAAIDHCLDPSKPPNTQSSGNSLLALCALIFATADSGRVTLVLEQLDRLDQFHEDAVQRIKNQAIDDPSFLNYLDSFAGPDHRFRLNVLRLAVARRDGEDAPLTRRIDELCQAMKTEEIPIVAWDAANTWFDNVQAYSWRDVMRQTPGVRYDASKGVRRYRFYDWPSGVSMDFEVQEMILRQIDQLMKESANDQ